MKYLITEYGDLLLTAMGQTLLLALYGLFFACIIGLIFGMLSVVKTRCATPSPLCLSISSAACR